MLVLTSKERMQGTGKHGFTTLAKLCVHARLSCLLMMHALLQHSFLQDALVADGAEQLKSLGICSGDLLWVLPPSLPSTTAVAAQPQHTSSISLAAEASDPGQGLQAMLLSPSPSATASLTAMQSTGPAPTTAMAAHVLEAAQAQAPETSGSSAATAAATTTATATATATTAHMDGVGGAMHSGPASLSAAAAAPAPADQPATLADAELADVDVILSHVEDAPLRPQVPDHLLRLLSLVLHSGNQQQQQQQQDRQLESLPGVQLLLLAVHAAMLESGFQTAEQPSSPPQPQPPTSAAPAAAGLSNEAPGAASHPSQQQRQHELLQLLTPHGGVYTLTYTWPRLPSSTPAEYPVECSGFLSPAAVQVELKVLDVGHFLVLAGRVKMPSTAAAAAGAAGMPGHVSGRLAGSSLGELHATAQTSTAGKAAAAAAAAATTTGVSVHQQQQQQVVVSATVQAAIACYVSLERLWVQLKDRCCLPLLVAAAAAAGLPPPVSLSSLPYELQELVLQHLEVSHKSWFESDATRSGQGGLRCARHHQKACSSIFSVLDDFQLAAFCYMGDCYMTI
jgi:hypothetical protein